MKNKPIFPEAPSHPRHNDYPKNNQNKGGKQMQLPLKARKAYQMNTEETTNMLKQDLKDGMIVETRNGERYLLANGIMRDFDGYTTLSNYSDDLKNKYSKDYDILKVYKDSGMHSLTSILKDGYLTLIWEHKEAKLTDREIEVLKALKMLGYGWLARDKNDKLFAYEKTPVKDTFIWFCKEEHYYYPVKENGFFNLVKWEDEEPISIDDLLKEVK